MRDRVLAEVAQRSVEFSSLETDVQKLSDIVLGRYLCLSRGLDQMTSRDLFQS